MKGSRNHGSNPNLAEYFENVVRLDSKLDYCGQIPITQYDSADVSWNIQQLFSALDVAYLHYERLSQAKKLSQEKIILQWQLDFGKMEKSKKCMKDLVHMDPHHQRFTLQKVKNVKGKENDGTAVLR